jgi:hypothetical protein
MNKIVLGGPNSKPARSSRCLEGLVPIVYIPFRKGRCSVGAETRVKTCQADRVVARVEEWVKAWGPARVDERVDGGVGGRVGGGELCDDMRYAFKPCF